MAVCFRQSFHLWVLLASITTFVRGAHGWMYNYSSGPNLRWLEARQWCQTHFTDMVPIHNQEEAEFLNNLLPFNPKYYWIGIFKVAEVWTWVETNESVPEELQRWTPGEPDHIAGQDCVEMYIKRDTDATRWNNERCRNKKGTACYSASCTQESCSVHADCVETVGNYTCKCHPGFEGPQCAEAIACESLPDPEQGSQNCFHSYGSNRFNSSCHFHCKLGFGLVGSTQLLCQSSGIWDHPVPLCQAAQCPVLNATHFSSGSIKCSDPIGPHRFNSSCKFGCDEGFKLIGPDQIRCDHTGVWTGRVPTCTARQCPLLAGPPQHGKLNCSNSSSFGSYCDVECTNGFQLQGASTVMCAISGLWSHDLPTCQPVQCEVISSLSSGLSMNCSHPMGNFSFGSECIFTCEDGFTLNGPAELICSSTGSWNDNLPQCLGVSTMITKLLYFVIGATSSSMLLTLIVLVLLVMARLKRKREDLLQ